MVERRDRLERWIDEDIEKGRYERERGGRYSRYEG
jgi:hypothetical protein